MLLKQDRSEAVLTVNGRVEFIEKEMYVADLASLICHWLLEGIIKNSVCQRGSIQQEVIVGERNIMMYSPVDDG